MNAGLTIDCGGNGADWFSPSVGERGCGRGEGVDWANGAAGKHS